MPLKTRRLSGRRERIENQSSIWFSQEAWVGVKWKCQRGWASSQAQTCGVLCRYRPAPPAGPTRTRAAPPAHATQRGTFSGLPSTEHLLPPGQRLRSETPPNPVRLIRRAGDGSGQRPDDASLARGRRQEARIGRSSLGALLSPRIARGPGSGRRRLRHGERCPTRGRRPEPALSGASFRISRRRRRSNPPRAPVRRQPF